jgi:basic membrane protein A
VGPIGDVGWTYAHEQGRKKMEELSFVKEANFKEMVSEESVVAKNQIREFAKTNNLVFTTSWGYMDSTIDVASEYKDVIFMHCSGCETAPNVGNYFGRIYEPYYLIGIIAGRMTKSNILGFVGAFPIPEVIRHLNAFALGARSVNPEVKVLVEWVGSWYAPDKERDAAENLLDKGADILSVNQDSPTALKTTEKQGKLAFGYNSSMKQFAPDAYLTAPIWDWGILYKEIATAVHEGTWTPQSIWKGMNTGVVQLDTMSKNVPLNVKRLVNVVKKEENGLMNNLTKLCQNTTIILLTAATTQDTSYQLTFIYVQHIDILYEITKCKNYGLDNLSGCYRYKYNGFMG